MRVLATLGFFGRFGETDGVVSTYSHLFPLFSRHRIQLDILCHGPENRIQTIADGVQVISHRPRVSVPLDKERVMDPLLSFGFGGREVRTRQYDLVQSSAPDPTGMVGLQVARRQGLPVVALYHTALDRYAEIRIGRGLGRTAGKAMGEAMRRFLVWYYNQADLILAPSENTRAEIAEWFTPRTDILSRGIDTERFHPRHRERSDTRIRVLYVGRVAPEKNIGLLAKIFASRNDADLAITGGGPHREDFQRMMPYATFSGLLRGDDLLRTYASADVFAFPSRTDTLGNVVLEAMASGLPVVVTNSMGPQELVQHGVTGFVAKTDEEFESYLTLLIRDHEVRQRMGAAARRAAENRTWEQVFNRLLGFYESVSAKPCRTQMRARRHRRSMQHHAPVDHSHGVQA